MLNDGNSMPSSRVQDGNMVKSCDPTKLSDTTAGGIRSTSFATCGVTCSTWINLETEGDSNTKGLARLTVNNSCKCLIIFVEHE